MKLTRRALKQSGAGLEAAIRRDMASTIAAELDNAAFNGAGSSGEPEGVLTHSTYNITSTAASATWAGFRSAVARFMSAHAVRSRSMVQVAIAPATWDTPVGTLSEDPSATIVLHKKVNPKSRG